MIILAFILILVIMNAINKALRTLERQQQVLCYDMYILSKKINEEERRILL